MMQIFIVGRNAGRYVIVTACVDALVTNYGRYTALLPNTSSMGQQLRGIDTP